MRKSVARLTSILHRQAQVFINYALKDYNITSAEYIFMIVLFREDGLTQDQLSHRLHIDRAATTRAVKSLIEKGYLYKEKHPDDKRCNYIYLTQKALKNKEDILKRIFYWNDFLTEGIDETRKDIAISVLEEMLSKLDHGIIKEKLEEL